jgi:hypothetical protein
MVQGEILEGLVARVVSRESSVQMEEVLKNFPQPSLDGGKLLQWSSFVVEWKYGLCKKISV